MFVNATVALVAFVLSFVGTAAIIPCVYFLLCACGLFAVSAVSFFKSYRNLGFPRDFSFAGRLFLYFLACVACQIVCLVFFDLLPQTEFVEGGSVFGLLSALIATAVVLALYVRNMKPKLGGGWH